jgi:acyl carrier protein
MDNSQVVFEIKKIVKDIVQDDEAQLTEQTSLIGENRVLDSLGLVELCLRLEELSQGLSFEFDWTSSTAMSSSRSMFRSIGTLADEFVNQSAAHKS